MDVVVGFDHDAVQKRCGGTYVSDQGDILTASHCLESCWQGNSSPQFPLKCSMSVNGNPEELEILAANTKCSIQEILAARENKDTNSPCFNMPSVDIAILRLKNSNREFKCLKLSDLDPSVLKKTDLFSLGYPSKTARVHPWSNNVKNSKGSGLYYSEGRIHDYEHCYTRDRAEKKVISNLGDVESVPMNIDIVKGSSGGAIISKKTGEVVGVAKAFNSNHHSELKECMGATQFQPINNLKEKLKKIGIDFKGELSCSEKKANFNKEKNGGRQLDVNDIIRHGGNTVEQ